MNQINLIGRVGKNPEIKNFDWGKTATFTLAVSERFNKDGKRVEETEWFNISVTGKQAEVVEKFLKKGDQVFISGKYKSREYTDKDGVKQVFREVRTNQIELLSNKPTESKQQDPTIPTDEPFQIYPDKEKETASFDTQAPADDLPF